MTTSFPRGALSLDTLPVGTVLDSDIDLETMTGGRWLMLDGRDVLRGQYPEIAPYYPVGTFTSTARTLNAIPVAATGAADGTNYLLPGAAGTSPLQASADGASWSTSATWAASTSPVCIILAGSRFVMAGSGGDLTVPYVSTANTYSAANQVAKSNWSATTVAGTSTNRECLAYSPQLGMTAMFPDGAGTTVHTLADGSTTWVARTVTSATKRSIVWTGQRFLITTPTIATAFQYSTNGTSWSDLTTPVFGFIINSMASDGNGTVIAVDGSNLLSGMLLVSKDHGATWRHINLPRHYQMGNVYPTGSTDTVDINGYLSYCNGRFFLSPPAAVRANTLVSVDGLHWQVDPIGFRGALTGTRNGITTHKAGVYLTINTSSASSYNYTSVENNAYFRLPVGGRGNNGTVQNMQPYFNLYMKVKST